MKKTLMLGKTESKRRRQGWGTRRLDSITDSVDTNSSQIQEMVEHRAAWCAAVPGVRVGHNLATEQQIALI